MSNASSRKSSRNSAEYEEVQRPPLWVMMILCAGIAAAWATLLPSALGIPIGQNPPPVALAWTLFAICGVVVPVLLLGMRLITRIEQKGVRVRFWPFVNWLIPFREIKSAQAKTYRPIPDYGGWGIRFGAGGKRAYTISGNTGVELQLKGGRTVLIGSKNAEQLANLLTSYLKS
jgi:hypothetical protein